MIPSRTTPAPVSTPVRKSPAPSPAPSAKRPAPSVEAPVEAAPRARASVSTQAAARRRATGAAPAAERQGPAAPTLAEARAGTRNIEPGQHGKSVKAVQHLLNQMGAKPIEESGIFDEATEKRVKQFQTRHGIPDSGKVGSRTLPALEKAVEVRAAAASESEKYDAYKARIIAAGGKFKSGVDERNILGIRSRTDPADSYYGDYDDKFAMLWVDKNGTKHCKEFTGNTEPNGRWKTSGGIQMDGDAALEEGRLRPGFYEYQFGTSTLDVPNNNHVLRPLRDAPVDRDMNNDGRFNDNRTSSGGAGSMLFHSGFDGNTASAGCQTLAPAQWAKFWAALQGARGTIGYTLVNK